MIAQLLGLIGEVVGVNTNAVAAYQTGTEAQSIPLGIHAVHHFVGIDAHAVKHHGQLIHEGNVDVPLAVLHYLDGLGSFDGGNGVSTHLDDLIIDMLDLVQGICIHTGDDLADVLQTMHLIAGVDTLGRVAHLEVHTALQAGFPLQNGNTYILGDTGINGGLVHNNGALGQVSTQQLGGADYRSQIRGVIQIYRRGNCHNVELGLSKLGGISGELHRGGLDGLIAHLVGGVDAPVIQIDLVLVQVKTDHIQTLAGKGDGDGHAHIAQSHQG